MNMRILTRVIGVSVLGGSGYAGGELLRLIAAHPDLALIAAGANERVGEPIGAVHPQLACSMPGEFVPNDSPAALGADLVFMALPHGVSGPLAERVDESTRVVDLGADHRLRNAAQWHAYYGASPHARAWAYGLPELPGRRPIIAGSSRVANPGCYATAIQLALAPLIAADVLADEPIAVVAASGTTGAGRKPTDGLLASSVLGSVAAYRAGGAHQHTPEIEQGLSDVGGRPVQICFTPLLAPMPRGIVATCIASAAGTITSAEAAEVLSTAYIGERFVTVLDGDTWPTSGATVGTNRAILRAVADERTGCITVVAALDNLGKGAAGQAIQNANLMLGIDEATGLTCEGVWP